MTKLEPTRTSSDLTATERLRRILDERGVEWDGCILMGAPITFWGEQERDGRWPYRYWEHDGWASFSADPKSELFTPEQAIAATLGTAPLLPHFWTHDGTLHIEATRMPTRIVVCEGGTCEFVPKRELDASEAENAKLRELVKALLTCATDGDCDECRLNGATPWHVGKAQLCDGVWDRVRELGVEVDA